MEFVLSVMKWGVIGFFGFIGALFALALVFGKRIEKKWEYEAKFRDSGGRELGEFDIQLSRIPKDETDFTFQAKFVLKHPALVCGSRVEVGLADDIVMEGMVEKEGWIHLNESHMVREVKSPEAGQICSVRCSGAELFAEPLYED